MATKSKAPNRSGSQTAQRGERGRNSQGGNRPQQPPAKARSQPRGEESPAAVVAPPKEVVVTEAITVRDLATLMQRSPSI
jgi:hypothetical protein